MVSELIFNYCEDNDGWEIKNIGDLAELKKETYKPIENDDLVYIGLEHIEQQTLKLSSIGSTKDVISNKFKFNKGDILFGKLRPYFRKVIMPNFNGVCSTDILVIKNKKNVDINYLYFLLASNEFINLSTKSSEGTRMPRANWKYLEKQKLLVPSYDIQKKIGEILISFQNKIESLDKQNKLLEKLGMKLFEKFFVRFEGYDGELVWNDDLEKEVPKDWKVEKVSEISETFLGGTPSTNKKEFWNGNIAWIKSGELNNLRIINPTSRITELGLKKSATKLMPIRTICVGITGYPGIISLLEIECCANQSVVGIKVNDILLEPYLFYYLKNRENNNRLIANTTGSAQQHINKNDVENFLVLIPEEKFLKNLNIIFTDILDKVKINLFEIETLTKLRDKLLPMLISGRIKV